MHIYDLHPAACTWDGKVGFFIAAIEGGCCEGTVFDVDEEGGMMLLSAALCRGCGTLLLVETGC